MKKLLLLSTATMIAASSFGQLVDEKNVTVTMDLQPVLQLSMQGPDQFDFTFDNINSYYAGITKYGANILRVSASVSFDLWAVGLSTQTDYLWDNVVSYSGGGGNLSMATLPITALELHQFPENPSVTAGGLCGFGGAAYIANNSYSTAFAAYDAMNNAMVAGSANNCIFTTPNANPYLPPADVAVGSEEKYISGAATDVAGCQTAAGSYLTEAFAAGVPATAGYFFIMDYRLLPGLPVTFPAQFPTNTANGGAGSSIETANAAAPTFSALSTLGDPAEPDYVAPGVYTMYIKYILAEDQ